MIYASGFSHPLYSQALHPTPRPQNTQPATHACSGKVKVSLCKCDPADVFNLLKQQFCAIHDKLQACPSIATASFLSSDDSGGLSWKLEKLGLIKQQIHVGFSIMYQVRNELQLHYNITTHAQRVFDEVLPWLVQLSQCSVCATFHCCVPSPT